MPKQRPQPIDLGERGKYNPANKLNELTGKEWIKFTKSWFIHNPPRRKKDEILHPAKFPETLAREFIEFFTKPGEWVLDPFLGTGSALVACARAGRNGLGIELASHFAKIAESRVEAEAGAGESRQIVRTADAQQLPDLVRAERLPDFDYCITSPPYWNQLKRKSIRQKGRVGRGLRTDYGNLRGDLGTIDDYDAFVERQAEIFDLVYDVLKPNGYLTIITNNVFADGRLFPLAFDTATSLTKRGERSWLLKDERIWLQNDKRLVALGVNNAWVGNRHHQYCLILRKPSE